MNVTTEPELRKGRGINPIWIIPALALGMGIYLVVHTWLTEGPDITITLDTAEGLVAGKTKVKYRNVEMGVLTNITLSDDYQKVEARVAMDYKARALLKPDTRFWVVTARVGVGNITGLDTLLSGAYIEMAPGSEQDTGTRHFEALSAAPLTAANAPGIRLNLLSDHAGSVSTGSAVLYKGYRVGRVEVAELDPERQKMRYVVFIDAPFDQLVDSAVRFWNTSGISLSAGAEGVKLRTGSLDTMLMGGIAFERPPGIDPGQSVESGADFQLFDSVKATRENPYRYGAYFVVMFSQSLKGLVPGAPVEYRGIRIGHVERIMLREVMTGTRERIDSASGPASLENQGAPLPVLVYLEPGRLALPDSERAVEALEDSIDEGIKGGLRAMLDTGNLLTGAKYINMDYFDAEDVPAAEPFMGYTIIPTIGGGFDQILVKVNSILDKVDNAPLGETVANANAAMAELQRVLNGLGNTLESDGATQLPAQLNETLAELSNALSGLSPDAELYQNLNAAMRQLSRAMANLEDLTQTLSDQPNAALVGSKLPDDPQPEAP